MFHDEGEAHREISFHAAERVISGRFSGPEFPQRGVDRATFLNTGMTAGACGSSVNTVYRSRNRRFFRSSR